MYGSHVGQPVPGAPGMRPTDDFLAGQPAEAFVSGFAQSVLRQSGENYFQRSQAFVQSQIGLLKSSALHYHFNVNSEFVRNKVLLMMSWFLKRWNYTRSLEQLAGGHKYLPPRQDVNAPDLYIPLMAMLSYCILASFSKLTVGGFSPQTMYTMVYSAAGVWLVQVFAIQGILTLLNLVNVVPVLETAAYAGYAFVPVCFSLVARLLLGPWAYRIALVYGSICMAVFMIRTMKRVIFHEARQYSIESTMHNYLLLGLGILQFVLAFWLGL